MATQAVLQPAKAPGGQQNRVLTSGNAQVQVRSTSSASNTSSTSTPATAPTARVETQFRGARAIAKLTYPCDSSTSLRSALPP